MVLAGCATNRESATSPFFPDGAVTELNGEYGDEISYWDDTRSSGKPRIIVNLEQQRAFFIGAVKLSAFQLSRPVEKAR
jgi:hypothetical protein